MKPLGICWIVYGILRVCVGVALVFLAPTATVMFGALLARVADPYTLMGMFHALYIFAIALSFGCGILGIAGGIAIFGNVRARIVDGDEPDGTFGNSVGNRPGRVHADCAIADSREGNQASKIRTECFRPGRLLQPILMGWLSRGFRYQQGWSP